VKAGGRCGLFSNARFRGAWMGAAEAEIPLFHPSSPRGFGGQPSRTQAGLPTAAPRARGGHGRNRTGVHGFAVRCVTTPPRGHWISTHSSRVGRFSDPAYIGGRRAPQRRPRAFPGEVGTGPPSGNAPKQMERFRAKWVAVRRPETQQIKELDTFAACARRASLWTRPFGLRFGRPCRRKASVSSAQTFRRGLCR
jgi:hypothetical protein